MISKITALTASKKAFKERLEKANEVGADEYRKNPAMREPETVEEAAQYLYFAAGLFGSEKIGWN